MPRTEYGKDRSQIMTVPEAAKYLGVHAMTIYRLLKRTDIPATKLLGQWRFKKDLLDRWLESQMHVRGGKVLRRNRK